MSAENIHEADEVGMKLCDCHCHDASGHEGLKLSHGMGCFFCGGFPGDPRAIPVDHGTPSGRPEGTYGPSADTQHHPDGWAWFSELHPGQRGILRQVMEELREATDKFGEFHSAHEGLAVLQEEFEELKAEVFKNQRSRDWAAMSKEAIQVAAMAIRFIVDITVPEKMPEVLADDKVMTEDYNEPERHLRDFRAESQEFHDLLERFPSYRHLAAMPGARYYDVPMDGGAHYRVMREGARWYTVDSGAQVIIRWADNDTTPLGKAPPSPAPETDPGANMTRGFVPFNRGGNDDEAFALKSSDVKPIPWDFLQGVESKPLGLVWSPNWRGNTYHAEWHQECLQDGSGCAFHPEGDQGPHVHACLKHDGGTVAWERDTLAAAIIPQLERKILQTVEDMADWLTDWFIDNHRTFQVKP